MGVEIQYVINIDVADERIIKRMSGRRVCENCGKPITSLTFHQRLRAFAMIVTAPLFSCKDDHPDTVLARLAVYHKETEPLADYYEKQGKLINVEGKDDVVSTTKLILEAIEA